MPYIIREEDLRRPLLRRQGDSGTVTPPGSTSTEPPTSTTPTSTSTTSTTSTTSETTSTTTTTTTPDSTTSTPNNGGSTTSAAPPGSTTLPGQSTTTPGPTSSSSMYETTAVITQGSTVYTTVFTTGTSVPVGGGGGSRSNTGAIVGGVVGGILGLLALLIIIWWIRKRNKNIKLDEDIFDPDRTAKRPGRLSGGIDLDDPAMEARPYNVPNVTGSTTAVGSGMAGAGAGIRGATSAQSHDSQYYNHHGPSPGEMFNYNQQVPGPYGTGIYPPNARPASVHLGGPTDISRGPSDASHYPPSSSAYYPPGPASDGTSGPGSDGGRSGVGGAFLAMPSAALPFSATQSSSSASAKARYAQQDRLQIANPADEGAGPVMQHLDGGRVHADPPTEVPPAYDSIPQEEAGPSSSGAAARAEAAAPEKGARS